MAGTREGMLKAWDTRGRGKQFDASATFADSLVKSGMSEDDAKAGTLAIMDYTGKEYTTLNDYERKGIVPDDSVEKHHELYAKSQILYQTLRAAPKYPDPVYRGVSNDVLAKMKVGSVFTDKGFMSASADEDVAVEFASRGVMGRARQGAIIEIRGKSGVDISSLSVNKVEEHEVLFPCKTRLRILKITKASKDDSFSHVVAEEVA